jgi:hypothetical protein
LLVRLVCALAGAHLLGPGALAMIVCLTLKRGGIGGIGGLRLSRPTLHLLSMLSGAFGVFGCLLDRLVRLRFVLDLDHGSRFGEFDQR